MRLLLLLTAPLIAGEVTVQPEPFRVEQKFQLSVVPTESTALTLDPESWSTFTIETLADHGSAVKTGDTLVRFEREDLERKIEDTRRAVAISKLALATQEHEFAKLKEEVAAKLEKSRRSSEIAQEDLEDFEKIGRPLAEKAVAERMAANEFSLSLEEEELKQLKQMYDADDLTEETEEIILERQKFAVRRAKFSLEQAKRAAGSELTFALPRQHEDYKRKASNAAIAHAKVEKNLPRTIETAKLELEGARTALQRQELELSRLEKDAELLEWKAPADGTIVHGHFEDGVWKLGDFAKSLRVGGSLPLQQAVLTFVPGSSGTQLAGLVDGAVARSLKAGTQAALSLDGSGEVMPEATIGSISESPNRSGKYLVSVTADWPASPWATAVNCQVLSYEKADAITVPSKALKLDANGAWTVEVKLADGETQSRSVTRGHSHSDKTEITEGLEAGLVIVAPGEK